MAKFLSHLHSHAGDSVVTHVEEVRHGAHEIVRECGEVHVGNVLLLAELPK